MTKPTHIEDMMNREYKYGFKTNIDSGSILTFVANIPPKDDPHQQNQNI